MFTKPVEAETDECRLKAQQAQELMKELKARSWGFWIFEKFWDMNTMAIHSIEISIIMEYEYIY